MNIILVGCIFVSLLNLTHFGECANINNSLCGSLNRCRAGATGSFWKCGASEFKSNSYLLWPNLFCSSKVIFEIPTCNKDSKLIFGHAFYLNSKLIQNSSLNFQKYLGYDWGEWRKHHINLDYQKLKNTWTLSFIEHLKVYIFLLFPCKN